MSTRVSKKKQATQQHSPAELACQDSEPLYHAIWEAASDAMVLSAPDGTVISANPAYFRLYGYAPEAILGKNFSVVFQQDRRAQAQKSYHATFQNPVITPRFETAIVSADRVEHIIEISYNFLTQNSTRTAMISTIRDITAFKRLEQQQERRTHHAALRADIGQALTERGSLQHMVQRCCKALVHHVPVDLARIWTLNNQQQVLELQASAGYPAHLGDADRSIPLGDPRVVRLLHRREPYLTNDAGNAPQISHGEWVRREGMVAFAGYPLIVDEQAVGVLVIYARQRLTEETFESLTIAADAIAQGIGRKWAEEQLEEHVQQRTRELSLLLAVSQTVASTLEWKPLLSIILEQLKTVVDYDSAILYNTQASQLAMLAYQGPQPQSLIQRLARIFEQGPIYKQICRQREPLIIGDLHNFPQFVQAYLQELGEPADTAYDQFRAWMGVPLIVRERVIGMLTLTHHLPDVYTPRHANLAFAMANQVAVALENANLYKQARVLAALQERQHLSRELHSSLSREMFGIRLSAQHAREALAADTYHEALAAIDRVIQYVEAGLAVMRALIFELRPDSLRSEGLVAALENLAAVVRTRYQLPIEAFLGKEPRLTLESKQALYRIAQEALQNVVKHSRALAVTLRLAQEDQEVVLEVRDDGRGFDPNRSINGGQGLQIMQEQIAPLGGTFTLVSAPGHGTSIIVRLPQRS